MRPMDKKQFLQGLNDSLILWDVGRMFHTRLSDGVLEDLSVLGIELMDRELTTRKDCRRWHRYLMLIRERWMQRCIQIVWLS